MPEDESFDLVGCLARVRLQDQAAARDLVEHLYPLVVRIIRAHLPRRVAKEDLARDICSENVPTASNGAKGPHPSRTGCRASR